MALPYKANHYNQVRLANMLGTDPIPQHIKDDLEHRHLLCMNCERKRRSKGGSKLKRMAITHMGGACMFCGYSDSIAALEFHHRDPEYKTFQITSSRASKFAETVEEVSKCDLICAACHGVHHTLEKLRERQAFIMSIHKKDEIHPDDQLEMLDQYAQKLKGVAVASTQVTAVPSIELIEEIQEESKKRKKEVEMDADAAIASIMANIL
jgi:hypothetical protein